MSQTNKKEELKEALGEIEFYTKKLAVLLHHLKAPEKVKQAWAAVLPKMPPKQISELIDVLEARYLNEQTAHIDKKLEQDVSKVVKDFEKKKSLKARELMDKVAKLAKKAEN